MKLQRLIILALAASVSVATHGQLFNPLGLGIDKCERVGGYFQPQMHVEGDILYVCTNQGLYSKNLSSEESTWQLAGFEGIPLQDYARRGNDIFAVQYDKMLLSHDGGKTYEDITPDLTEGYNIPTEFKRLAQHPNDTNMLLVLSGGTGMFQSADFGQTWKSLRENDLLYIGYHPLNPEIIYLSGRNGGYEPLLNISYDSGLTWISLHPDNSGDNSVYRLAFHPTDPEKWIAGGFCVVYTTTDNGHTWNTQHFSGVYKAWWSYTVFDNENSNVIYMAGGLDETINVMCSTDGGKSWNIPQTEPKKKPISEGVYDFKQYGNKLLVYTGSDVYEISKADFLSKVTSVRSITTATTEESSEIYDLQGRRLSAMPQKGVYIQNGKKKLVK